MSQNCQEKHIIFKYNPQLPTNLLLPLTYIGLPNPQLPLVVLYPSRQCTGQAGHGRGHFLGKDES